jgi:hypothetical protein
LVTRRRLIGALLALPAIGLAEEAAAREYAGAAEVLAAIDSLSAALETRLLALGRALPTAARFVDSARADLVRHRRERGGRAAAISGDVEQPRSLARLKSAFEELMHAHAEGLPAMRGDAARVQRMAAHMVDLSRLATVVDLWIEQEGLGE